MRRNPRCAVASSVPVFTYASRLPVTRQPAGVLVAVGYMRYLALMPPPAVSTPTGYTNEMPLSGSQWCPRYYAGFTL